MDLIERGVYAGSSLKWPHRRPGTNINSISFTPWPLLSLPHNAPISSEAEAAVQYRLEQLNVVSASSMTGST